VPALFYHESLEGLRDVSEVGVDEVFVVPGDQRILLLCVPQVEETAESIGTEKGKDCEG